LRFLEAAGITPGARVRVVRRGPVAGPLFVSVEGDDGEHALSQDLAEAVWVA
jgi:Fe2+ transport system protein FeoA